MLTKQEIAEMCNARALQRARSIARSSRDILTRQVRYDGNDVTLSAFVASSSGWSDRYRSSVTFDDLTGYIEDYVCTCPAYRAYDGMCKHCAALALAYVDHPESFMGYRSTRDEATSPAIAALLRRAESVAEEELPDGSVDISPELTCGYGDWSAGFRLTGPAGSYVMKSIGDFVERMRQAERFAYGKNLCFTHTERVLTDRGKLIARFLDQRLSALAQAHNATTWYGYRPASAAGRRIDLEEADVAALLDCLEVGDEVEITGTDPSVQTLTNARIASGDPGINVRIDRSERGGYRVSVDGADRCIGDASSLYAWRADELIRCPKNVAAASDLLHAVLNADNEAVFVSSADMPLFCSAVLPGAEQAVHVEAPPEVRSLKPVPCEVEFYFDRVRTMITVAAQATYGKAVYPIVGAPPKRTAPEGKADGTTDAEQAKAGAEALPESEHIAAEAHRTTSQATSTGAPVPDAGAPAIEPMRDTKSEKRARALVERYFGEGEESIPLDDGDRAARLLFGGLAEFRTLGTVYTTPAFDRLVRDGKPRITMGVSLSGNLINLTVQATDLPSGELAALLASYRAHKRYHRLRSGAFLDMKDMDLSQLDRVAKDLGVTAKDLTSGQVELPSFRAFYLDAEADLERDRSFEQYLDRFKETDERSYEPPEELAPILRPYQAEGFRWLSARCDAGFGGVLADEMGLGKSIQLISLLLARAEEARAVGPSLIVCPASLVYNWLAELARFAPGLKAAAVVGPARDRARIRDAAFGDVPSKKRADVLVTSYDLARIDSDAWERRELFCCALDEAQYIKNPATLTTRAVKRIRARHRFALTGTPMENRLSELWSIFDFLMPGLLGPYSLFRERFEGPIVGGDEAVAERLQAVVGPFLLRRRKKDVLADLPEKLETVVYAHMGKRQRALYDAHEQKLREDLTAQRRERKARGEARAAGKDVPTVEVLAELTRLRQICCDPRLLYENFSGHGAKLDAIMDIVAAAHDAGEKALVFSQFTSFLSLIADALDKNKVPYYSITGKTPKRKRLELVDRFNADNTPVFLVSLKAGGTGLNLTGASVVVHADPWWNAAAQDQATDRAHRIGQTHVVSVQKVIAKGTIEERIMTLQEEKSKLAAQVVGASGVSLAGLTRDDIAELLEV